MIERIFMARCLVAISAISAAAYVSAGGHDGWGWFLLVAVLVSPSFESSRKR